MRARRYDCCFCSSIEGASNIESKVVGVDPASLDYSGQFRSRLATTSSQLKEILGEPWTLGEAQAELSSTPFGGYLSFRQTTAPALVASQPVGTYTQHTSRTLCTTFPPQQPWSKLSGPYW